MWPYQTFLSENQVVFSGNVIGYADLTDGCGIPGKQVVFYIGATTLQPSPLWNNTRLWHVNLISQGGAKIYLPVLIQ